MDFAARILSLQEGIVFSGVCLPVRSRGSLSQPHQTRSVQTRSLGDPTLRPVGKQTVSLQLKDLFLINVKSCQIR